MSMQLHAFSESDVLLLQSRANFYESCVDQLKKELPKYTRAQSSVSSAGMSKVLKSVASSEPDRRLQNCLFLYAQKYELLERERTVFKRCEDQTAALLEEAKASTIAPLREIIAESPQTRKNKVLQQPDPTLPIHAHFFEVHRTKCLKKVLKNMLYSELRYHIKVVEELSQVLSTLDAIDS